MLSVEHILPMTLGDSSPPKSPLILNFGPSFVSLERVKPEFSNLVHM